MIAINHKIYLIFFLVIISCNSKQKDLKENNRNITLVKEKEYNFAIQKGNYEHIDYTLDYNELKAYLFLIDETDTINSFEFNDVYAAPKFKKLDNYFLIKFSNRSSLKSETTYVFDEKLNFIFDFFNLQSNLGDNFFDEVYYDSVSIRLVDDFFVLNGFKIEGTDTTYYTKKYNKPQ